MPWIPWAQGLCFVSLNFLVVNNFIIGSGWIFWIEFVSLYLNFLLKFHESNGKVCNIKIPYFPKRKSRISQKVYETAIKFNSECRTIFFNYKSTLELVSTKRKAVGESSSLMWLCILWRQKKSQNMCWCQKI